MYNGESLENISKNFNEKYSELPDLEEFIKALEEYGFIGDEKTQIPKSTFPFIKPEDVKWLYNTPALTIYLFVIVLGLGLLFLNPTYFPIYDDYFISENYFITLTGNLILGVLMLSIHELSHLFAGRAKGVYGRIGFGLRLYFPVAETDLTVLWQLEPKKRILPFLAGIITDLVMASMGIFLLYSYDQGLLIFSPMSKRVIEACILIIWYGLLWQFMLFIKTDLYFVVSNILKVRNLYDESMNYIMYNIGKIRGISNPHMYPKKDKSIIKLYSFIILIFSAYSILIFMFYGIPIFSIIILESIETILTWPSPDIVIQYLVTLLLSSIQLLVFFFFIFKSTKKAYYSIIRHKS